MPNGSSGKILAKLAALAAVLAATALYTGHRLEASMEERANVAAGTRVQVRPGASLRAVLGELARVGGVPHPAAGGMGFATPWAEPARPGGQL